VVDLDWHDFYEMGIEFIDQEHKEILAIMRNIRDAINTGNLVRCSYLSGRLIREAENHFNNEEEYLEQLKFPGLKEHKEYHAELLMQAHQVKKICEGSKKDHNLTECFNAMEKFLIDDVLYGDVQFQSFLEYKGLIKPK